MTWDGKFTTNREAVPVSNSPADGTPRHSARHPTTGRFVPANKPQRGMEIGFGTKGARPTQ